VVDLKGYGGFPEIGFIMVYNGKPIELDGFWYSHLSTKTRWIMYPCTKDERLFIYNLVNAYVIHVFCVSQITGNHPRTTICAALSDRHAIVEDNPSTLPWGHGQPSDSWPRGELVTSMLEPG
jgi:hypothetical protein